MAYGESSAYMAKNNDVSMSEHRNEHFAGNDVFGGAFYAIFLKVKSFLACYVLIIFYLIVLQSLLKLKIVLM